MCSLALWSLTTRFASAHPGDPAGFQTLRRAVAIIALSFSFGMQPLQAQEWVPVLADATGSIVSPTNFTAGNVDSGLIFGWEYFSCFHSKIMSGQKPIVVFSGDSTTEGAGISDLATSALHQAVKSTLLNHLPGVECINAGHAGMSIHQWVTNFVNLDLGRRPDLYILRWGLNPNLESTFEADLRLGLARLRQQFPVDTMSVLLMTPNACNDAPNGRDRAYLDTINPIIRRAARDYKCGFIDLARLFPDAFSDPVMMDDPFGDGRRIHPRDVFNQSIASLITQVVLPEGVANFGAARLRNLSFAEFGPHVETLPVNYGMGINMHRAVSSMGWPLDGAVVTERQVDGIWRQMNYAFAGPEMRTRTGSWGGWNSWGDAIIVNPATADPQLATVSAGADWSRYPSGLSVWPALQDRGWIEAGSLLNVRQADGTTFQINAGTNGTIAMRTRSSAGSWNPWNCIDTRYLSRGAPTPTSGAASGTGAVITVEGTDLNGSITLVTGDTPVAGEVLTLAWSRAFRRKPHPILTAANAAAAGLANGQQVFVSRCDTHSMALQTAGEPLAPHAAYVWHFFVDASSDVASIPLGEPPTIAAHRTSAGGLALQLFRTRPGQVVVEHSSDLLNWEPFRILQVSSDSVTVDLGITTAEGADFYRANLGAGQ